MVGKLRYLFLVITEKLTRARDLQGKPFYSQLFLLTIKSRSEAKPGEARPRQVKNASEKRMQDVFHFMRGAQIIKQNEVF